MQWPGHINANPAFRSHSCLNAFVKAEHDKILGQNDRKISSFDMQSGS